jgi:hypothetical protein
MVEIYCAHKESVPISELREHPKNPNIHPKAQVAALAALIMRYGWRQAITVSTLSGYVVRGHGRLYAARHAGLTHAPVDYQDYASYQDELADLWADNKIAELSFLDSEAEAALMSDIGELLGDIGEIKVMLADIPAIELDAPAYRDGKKQKASLSVTFYENDRIEIIDQIKAIGKKYDGFRLYV